MHKTTGNIHNDEKVAILRLFFCSWANHSLLNCCYKCISPSVLHFLVPDSVDFTINSIAVAGSACEPAAKATFSLDAKMRKLVFRGKEAINFVSRNSHTFCGCVVLQHFVATGGRQQTSRVLPANQTQKRPKR
jgi:hypothetical protein